MSEIGEDEVIYFVDAVHPQYNTRSTYAWIKCGEEAERINTQANIKLHEKIQANNLDKELIYVIGDNARYYRNVELQAWLDKIPLIVQLFLPPYSPNLNLIEKLWKFMRKKIINTKFYSTFEEFRQAVLIFFDNTKGYKDELQTLITFNFQRLNKPVLAL